MTDMGPIPPSPGDVPPPGSVPSPGPAPAGQPLGYSTPAPAGGLPYAGPAPTPEERTLGMLAHLLGVFWFIGPLIIWLIKKDQSPFVDDQGKEALNFQLTLLIADVIGIATSFICIGLVILPIVWAVRIIFCILGAVKAYQGVAYRYPFAIRMIK